MSMMAGTLPAVLAAERHKRRSRDDRQETRTGFARLRADCVFVV